MAKGTAAKKSDLDLLVDSKLRGLKFVGFIEAVRQAVGECGRNLGTFCRFSCNIAAIVAAKTKNLENHDEERQAKHESAI